MRVLLVEDDALVRFYAAEALADEGFEVVEADTADEALRLCAESAPDVLFTDILSFPRESSSLRRSRIAGPGQRHVEHELARRRAGVDSHVHNPQADALRL
jgi:DNA-binding response OmpR family regulator